MSERTATRIAIGPGRAGTLAAAVVAWVVAAWLLSRTSVPALHLGGADQHRYFSPQLLARARRYSLGVDVLWAVSTLASLAALFVLAWRLPRSVRGIGLGRIGSAVVVGMVILVTLWFVRLPFGLAGLWWQHRYGLGPFNVGGWLAGLWGSLAAEAVSIMFAIVLLVGLAGRFRRGWWLIAAPAFVAIAAAFAFASGYLSAAGTHPLRDRRLAADVRRLENVEHVGGTPVSVENVSSWTDQVNAFSTGFGPSGRVVLWSTLLDGRFSRGEEDVVVAHELGHVRSRHVLKALGWSALVILPTLGVVAFATRRRGGVGDPANLPRVFLVLALIALAAAPLQNLVSRRYEREADWRALNATRDPASARGLFREFARTSLEDPDPPIWDYVWLENHPTLMQRIAMTRAWAARGRQ